MLTSPRWLRRLMRRLPAWQPRRPHIMLTSGAVLVTAVLVGVVALMGSGESAGEGKAGEGKAAPVAVPCDLFFDDFAYESVQDERFTDAGWTARAQAGGPGAPGATWSADSITFPEVGGDKVAQLSASTDGTAAGTVQAEMVQANRRFREGTYASRIYFTGQPTSGQDGDHVMQAYVAMSPLKADLDPEYSQLSLTEYTPNGAWGGNEPVRSHASVHTIQVDPYRAKQAVATVPGRFDGWHTIVAQVGSGHVRYFVDGFQIADHVDDGEGNTVLPRVDMSLHYNTWFTDLTGHKGGNSTYVQQVDWTYYAQGSIVAPSNVVSEAQAHRAAGLAHIDTLPAPATATAKKPANGECVR